MTCFIMLANISLGLDDYSACRSLCRFALKDGAQEIARDLFGIAAVKRSGKDWPRFTETRTN